MIGGQSVTSMAIVLVKVGGDRQHGGWGEGSELTDELIGLRRLVWGGCGGRWVFFGGGGGAAQPISSVFGVGSGG